VYWSDPRGNGVHVEEDTRMSYVTWKTVMFAKKDRIVEPPWDTRVKGKAFLDTLFAAWWEVVNAKLYVGGSCLLLPFSRCAHFGDLSGLGKRYG
jgi:hypothetical protein